MKSKKKGSNPVKKTTKKPAQKLPLFLIEKTVVTTKEKTHNTIEDPV